MKTRFLLAPALLLSAPHAHAQTGAFDLYVAAARAIVPAKPPVDQVNDGQIRPPQEQAQLYTSARRTAFFRANRPAMELFERAKAAPMRSHVGQGESLNLGPYASLRELARVKTIEAKEWKWRGKWGKALDSGLDILQMGGAIEDPRSDSPLIGSLVGIAVQAIGAYSILDVPPHLNALESKHGAARLEAILARTPRFSQVLQRDTWRTQSELLQMSQKTPESRPGASQPFWKSPSQPQTPRVTLAQIETMNAAIAPIIAQADRPFGALHLPPDDAKMSNSLGYETAGTARRALWNNARRLATSQQLLLRLALRAYRLENGVYPDNLGQLSPKYLQKVPVDPFGKSENWRYKRVGDSYTAWSIGPDGKDNGGKPIPPRQPKGRVFIYDGSLGDWIARP